MSHYFPQSQTGIEADAPMSEVSQTEGEVNYGEINFIKKTPEASSSPRVQNSDQQETVYAQVKVSTAENSSTQTAESPESLYAQVKKK